MLVGPAARRLGCALAALALIAPPAPAENVDWINGEGGSFQDGSNWDGGIVPGITDNAFFFLSSAGGYSVQFDGDHETARVVVRNDVVVFDLAGFTYTLNQIGSPSFVVGQSGSDNSFLTLVNGQVNAVSLVVGDAGTGSLTISGNAQVSCLGMGIIGNASTGMGDVQVFGSDTMLNINTSPFHVGGNGTGSLLIGQGARVSSSNSFIAALPGSAGSVTVIDPGSEFFPNDLVVGSEGTGSLLAANGGQVLVGDDLVVGQGGASAGDLAVVGPGSSVGAGDKVTVWAGSSALIASGGSVASGGISTVGLGAGRAATATITGTGSEWASATFRVGLEGDGTVLVQNGGAGSSLGATTIGREGGIGLIHVTGPGSAWNVVNSGFVVGGFEGQGRLVVDRGASAFADQDTSIGEGNNASGEIEICGPDSTLTIQVRLDIGKTPANSQGTLRIVEGADALVDGFIDIGFQGRGTLEVASGGYCATTAAVFIASQGGSGTLSVRDPGSALNVGTDLEVGCTDLATVIIADGGQVTVGGSSTMAGARTAVGRATVSGPTTVWSSGVALVVGDMGRASLELQDGATVSAPLIDIGTNGIVSGNGFLNGTVHNGGSVSPGLSAGGLTIVGGYTQAPGGTTQEPGGRLNIELGGPDPVLEHDQIAVIGDVSLAGTLVIRTINGFEPVVGEQFKIVTGSTVTGAFDHVSGDGRYKVSYSPNSVVLKFLGASIHGNLDGDGVVNVVDLIDLLLCFGQPAFPGCEAKDVNQDGTVNVLDLIDVLLAFGAGSPGAVCP